MTRAFARILAIAAIVTLTGCIGDSKMANDSNNAPSVTVQTPPPQFVDSSKLDEKLGKVQSDLRNEIQTSTNNTQTHMNGLVDTSISKIGERVTGVEANIKEAIGIKNELQAEITGVKADLKAEINMKNEIKGDIAAVKGDISGVKAEITSQITNQIGDVNAKLAENIKVTNELKSNIQGQAGIGNSIKNIEEKLTQNLTAGRDVNMLSKEAVTLVLGIFTGLFAIVLVAVVWLGRNAREREALRTQEERANVERWQAVAMQAMSRLSPEQSRDITLPPLPKA
jgi:hypothetical protein